MTNQPNRRPRYVYRQRADNPLHPLRNRVRAELGQEIPPPDEPMPSTRMVPASCLAFSQQHEGGPWEVLRWVAEKGDTQ